MPFDWEQFLTLAERISTIDLEAAQRTAISRAYYAAFHVAEAKCSQSLNLPRTDDGTFSHDQVWSWYRARGIAAYSEVARLGFRLKRQRGRADYREEVPELKRQVEFSLKDAGDLIALLKGIP